ATARLCCTSSCSATSKVKGLGTSTRDEVTETCAEGGVGLCPHVDETSHNQERRRATKETNGTLRKPHCHPGTILSSLILIIQPLSGGCQRVCTVHTDRFEYSPVRLRLLLGREKEKPERRDYK